MKSSIDHLPPPKQRELTRTVEVLLEEFDDALKGATADFKKRGRILKIILFGSYARGGWVDEPHTKKGYRSDFDLLVVVNNRKLTDFASYWQAAADRLMREIETPVSFIVHSRREVNTALREGQYFFVDIRRDGILLYELDDEPLTNPIPVKPADALRVATEYLEDRLPHARKFAKGATFYLGEKDYKESAFLLHQSIEQAYGALLLVLTNYSPASHNIKFLRSLAEDQAQELAEVWPRDQQRFVAWFNILNEAYVKARYSRHFEITDEALQWLAERVSDLIDRVEAICRAWLENLKNDAGSAARRAG
ncbi:MAG: HEPN domain-containing protein [Mesorhizobium sp.]|uniref:nucleotidyltransferase and HEPN domain-containing protein n=1 Tax=Mesorhizobium sp. TaxID=1871066 RepID=UPI0012025012|nr:nucleotidyltransferase and HEPN domain-containing protein [Mesorhizobium sp.]TIR18324.1 MAG: HEPN domain-containing protein [Mesorhizobium sp.]